MATKKPTPKVVSVVDLLREQHSKGTEVMLYGTDRLIRLRPLDAETLLREGKMPDILTPLVTKSVFQELPDKEVKEFLGKSRGNNPAEALALLETIDFVCEKSIADGTKVKELTLAEKRLIFRLAVGPAELLIDFRYDENLDVESVAEGENVQPATE